MEAAPRETLEHHYQRQEKSKHWTITMYKLIYVRQTVPRVLSNVGLDSAIDTGEGRAGHGGITNYGDHSSGTVCGVIHSRIGLIQH